MARILTPPKKWKTSAKSAIAKSLKAGVREGIEEATAGRRKLAKQIATSVKSGGVMTAKKLYTEKKNKRAYTK